MNNVHYQISISSRRKSQKLQESTRDKALAKFHEVLDNLEVGETAELALVEEGKSNYVHDFEYKITRQ